MRNVKQIVFVILCQLIVNLNILAQTKEWKTDKVDGGKIIVKSCIYKLNDELGNDFPMVEYTATITDNASMQKCIELLKDVSKHKQFLDDIKSAKKIKTLSDNEYLIYYYFSPPLFSASDCVATMTFSEDLKSKTAVFKITAEPLMYKKTDVKRYSCYNLQYDIKDKGNGKLEITLIAKVMPVISVPLWMIRSAFPDAAAKIVRKLVKASQ